MAPSRPLAGFRLWRIDTHGHDVRVVMLPMVHRRGTAAQRPERHGRSDTVRSNESAAPISLAIDLDIRREVG